MAKKMKSPDASSKASLSTDKESQTSKKVASNKKVTRVKNAEVAPAGTAKTKAKTKSSPSSKEKEILIKTVVLPQTKAIPVKRKSSKAKSLGSDSEQPTQSEAEISTPPTAQVISKKPEPTREEIAIRAYLISENRQRYGIPGNEGEDWVQAEQELYAEWEQTQN